MTGSAKRWLQDYKQSRPAGSLPFTWDQYSQLFLDKCIPFTLRAGYHRQFERLHHGSMIVTQCETRFVDLAHHAIIVFPTGKERVRRFIVGLTFSNRLQMNKENGDDISFQRALEIARRIEMIRSQDREVVSEKWPHLFEGFSGNRGSHGYRPEQQAFSAPSAPISALMLQSHYSCYPVRQGQSQL
ncbi:uncharacterized protein [Nicotiana tomentosiformis]|uniref:uncharacterized protein n=1 Tax=Nicotiana tomentosiformis TaxID=4098 RepID=UPI00051C6B42|nr:uncharacterized protein LOC117279022 [Nicotiana tomentosiformis]